VKFILLFMVGIASGSFIAFQSILNSALGRRVGNFGSVFIVTIGSLLLVTALILAWPATSSLKALPGPRQWYLYLGGILGIFIVVTPILLVPRIGTTSTLTALIVGQLVTALILDQIGILGAPRIPFSITRLIGALLLVVGAVLVARGR
jgi:transporter family-2 protein